VSRRRTEIEWIGKNAPTAADLRALARAKLPPGRFTASARTVPRARNMSPTEAAFTAFHWGKPPDRLRRVALPSTKGGIYALGRLRAVEYETTKGKTKAIWRHRFEKPFPLLTANAFGRLGPIVGGNARVTPRGIER